MNKFLSSLMSFVLAVGLGVPTEAIAVVLEDDGSAAETVDITEAWAQGALSITEAGTYVLSGDVETDGALTVAVAAGEEVVIDLAGHSVTVEGEVFCGIDVSGSEGSVVIEDSTYDERAGEAEESGGEAKRAVIAVVAHKAEDAAAGVLANYLPGDEGDDAEDAASPELTLRDVSVSVSIETVDSEAAGSAHDVYAVYLGFEDGDDARGELDAVLDGVELKATLAAADLGEEELAELEESGEAALDEESAGNAYGVYATSANVALDGSFSSETESLGLTCDLYSTVEGAFVFGEGLEISSELRVYADGNGEGTVLASVEDGAGFGVDELGLLEDASGQGNVVEAEDEVLIFAAASSAAASVASDGDDGASVASEEEEEEEEEEGEEEAVWQVARSSGTIMGTYADFDDAEDALPSGGTVTLLEDQSGVNVTFDKDSNKSYTLDLAGHSIGTLTMKSNGTLSVVSSEEGAVIGEGSSSMYGLVVRGSSSSKGSGSLNLSGVKVVCNGSTETLSYGLYLYTTGDIVLQDVEVVASSSSGSVYALQLLQSSGTMTASNCSFYASGLEGGATSVYAASLSANDFMATECTFVAESDGDGTVCGSYGYGDSSFEDCVFSASSSAADRALGLWILFGDADVEDCEIVAESAEGVSYAFYRFSAYTFDDTVTLGGETVLSGGTAEIYLTQAISLAADFSMSNTARVYALDYFPSDVFAYLEDGADGEALLALFDTAEGSYYDGYEMALSSDGSSLKWSVPRESVDLYELLTEDGEPLSEDVELSNTCDYYLSQDVEGYSGWILCPEGGEYNIDLRGNSITFASGGIKSSVKSEAVLLDICSTDGEGNPKQGGLSEGQIYCYYDVDFSMSDVAFTMEKNTGTYYNTQAVYFGEGVDGVSIENCSISVKYASEDAGSAYNNVVAVRMDNSSSGAVSISNTDIEAISESSYDAVGLFVMVAKGSFVVEDCSISAESTGGGAVALYNDKFFSGRPKLQISGDVNLSATGAADAVSFGILNLEGSYGTQATSSDGNAVVLNGSISFSSESEGTVAALASDRQAASASAAPFTLGADFSADEALSVIMGLELSVSGTGQRYWRPYVPDDISEDANKAGIYIASFASTVDDADYESMYSLFYNVNPLVSTEPALDEDGGVYFEAMQVVCVAHIERDGQSVEFTSFDKATAAAADGETVVLDMDVTGTATIAENTSVEEASISYTIDLNGYDIGCLSCETSQDVTVVDGSESSESVVIGLSSDGNMFGIVQEGAGTLSVVGVSVDMDNASGTNISGMRVVSGSVEMTDCDISIDANSGTVRAVYAASGTTVEMQDCTVDVEESADAAYGVCVASGTASASVYGCNVSVASSGEEAAAVRVLNGTITVGPSDTADSALSAMAGSSSTTVYGVLAMGYACVGLEACSLSATATSDTQGYAFDVYATRTTSSTTTSSVAPEVTMRGTITFGSSTETNIYHEAGALLIGDDFALGGDLSTITVQSVDLDDDNVFAEPADDGGSLEHLADVFEAASTSSNAYIGYEVEANDDGTLSWTRDFVAELTSDGLLGETTKKYKSLAQALAAATEGDTITMIADSTEAALEVTCGVTIDLAGYSVNVLSTSSSSAVSVTSGRLTLQDSSEETEGVLSITLMKSNTVSKDYTQTDAKMASVNVGLYAGSGAGITLDGCKVQVTASTSDMKVGVTGIYAASGASGDGAAPILLTGGAELTVSAGTAMKAYGVYTGSGYTDGVPAIQIDEDASVSVSNDNELLEVDYSNPSTGMTVGGEVWLKEIDVDKSSDLWAEICEAFLKYATYTSTSSVYSMAQVELSDGTLVWAYSDVVDYADAGLEEYIVPSTVYEMSDAQISPDAVGVGDYGSSGATVQVEGSVSAESANGNAYALLVSANSTWNVNGATLEATSNATQSYLRLSQYAPDGAEYFTTAGNNDYRSVERVKSVAATVATGELSASRANSGYDEATVVLSSEVDMDASAIGGFSSEVMVGQLDLDEDFSAQEGSVRVSDESGETSWGDVFAVSADDAEITDDQVAAFADANDVFIAVLSDDATSISWDYGSVTARATVTFTGAYDANASKLDSVSIEVQAGVALGESNAAQAPEAEDYGSYRFVGWKESSSGDVVDPECLGSYVIDGDTTFTASYIYVSSSQQLVVFKVDDLLFAGAVDDGLAVTWKQVSGSSSSPSRTLSGTWEFAGWYAGDCEEYLELDADDCTYAASDVLPVAVGGGEDVWYTAVFEGDSTATSSVTLYYYSAWDTSGEWTYGSGTLVLADGTDISSDASVTSGDYLVSGVAQDCVTQSSDGTWETHEFLGWSVRSDDVAPLSSLPAVGEGVTTYYAIYDTHDMDVDVTFWGDDESCTVTVGSSDSVATAMAADGYALSAPAGKQLAGWAYEEDAESAAFTSYAFIYMYSSDNFVAPENGEGDITGEATFYAVWETADPVNMTLHVNGGMWSDSNADDLEAEVTPGIAIEWGNYSAPYKYGCYFLEWNDEEDGSGDEFDVTADIVPDDGLELWAQYREIDVEDVAEGSSVDVSAACVRSRAAAGASSVSVSFAEASDVDGDMSISSSSYKTLEDYRLSVQIVYDEGTSFETSSELTSGFGTLTLSMPVDEAYAERDLYAFVLDSDGTTTKTACEVSESDDGTVLATFSVSSYASSTAGNVVLAYALTSDEIDLNSAISQAQTQLNAYYATFSQDDYTGDEGTGTWGELCTYYEDGLAAIAEATTLEEVAEAYETAANGMASVETTAGLANAKAEALERLAEAYAEYSSEDYSSDNWAELVAAYEEAKDAIEAAETASEASVAASAGIIAMAGIEVDTSSSSSSSTTTASGSSGLSSNSSSGLSSSSSGLSSSSSGLSSSSSLSSSSDSDDSTTTTSSSSSSSSSSGSDGTVSSSTLGGTFMTVTTSVADTYALQTDSGVVVTEVEEGGALEAAGVQVGDVIVAVDGQAVSSIEDLEEYLSSKSVGDVVELTVNRGGEELTLELTLGETDEEDADESSEDGSGLKVVAKWLGNHLVVVIPLLIVVLLLLGLLLWLLLRRRKKQEDDEDEGEDGDGSEPRRQNGVEDDGFWSESR